MAVEKRGAGFYIQEAGEKDGEVGGSAGDGASPLLCPLNSPSVPPRNFVKRLCKLQGKRKDTMMCFMWEGGDWGGGGVETRGRGAALRTDSKTGRTC